MSCRKGELVTRLDATHGWTLCQAESGEQGWFPDNCLQHE
ncbi:MAG: SH3 domain-containing protein [Rhizobiaceae bacterium]